MNGAESLILTALNCGVDVCFANPGTTEMPLVAALDGADADARGAGAVRGRCAPAPPTATRGWRTSPRSR